MIRRDLLPLVKSVTPDNKKGEYYLTDICKTARAAGVTATAFFHPRPSEVLGINDRADLLEAATAVKDAILDRHMEAGVAIMGRNTYIEAEVAIGQDTVVYPDCYLMGRTEIGRRRLHRPACSHQGLGHRGRRLDRGLQLLRRRKGGAGRQDRPFLAPPAEHGACGKRPHRQLRRA